MSIYFLKRKKAENDLRVFRESVEAEQTTKLLYSLFFGFFGGILVMVLKKESLLYGTGFLDSYTLGPVKYLEPDTGKLLITVVMQRFGAVVLLIILATTYLGSVTAHLYQVWSGLSMGILTTGSVLRYGMKGLFLAAGSLLPQQLILIPAFLMLSVKCCELCKNMYFGGMTGGFSGREKGKFLLKKGLDIITCVIFVAVGCFVEACINPGVLKWILRHF